MYDWLGARFGYDSVFMDVAAIPIAVSFPEFIRQAIENSGVLLALIGARWADRIHDANDPVRMEIEAAIENRIPLLPVLIGNTPMPDADKLPASISEIASQNAVTVGVLLDFHSHMKVLLPRIEVILGDLSVTSIMHSEPHLIQRACSAVIDYLRASSGESTSWPMVSAEWKVIGADGFFQPPQGITLYLHRVKHLAEELELHFILSFWAGDAGSEQAIAGWVMSQLEQHPFIPDEYFAPYGMTTECFLKVRWSDEDPRQVWKTITDEPLRLSLAYVATISPKDLDTRQRMLAEAQDAGTHLESDTGQPPQVGDSPQTTD